MIPQKMWVLGVRGILTSLLEDLVPFVAGSSNKGNNTWLLFGVRAASLNAGARNHLRRNIICWFESVYFRGPERVNLQPVSTLVTQKGWTYNPGFGRL